MAFFNLKNTLVIDGITCTALFLMCVFGAATVASWLGLPLQVIAVAGWIGLPSALLMFGVAAQARPNLMLANLIAIGNLGWVAASIAVVATFAGQMSWVGIVVVSVQAIVVLDFAILEALGAKSLNRKLAIS